MPALLVAALAVPPALLPEGVLQPSVTPSSSVGGKDPIGAPSGRWTLQPGELNCYDGHGAPGASGSPHAESIAVDECKKACLSASGCQAVVVKFESPPELRAWSNLVTCYLRGDVRPRDCHTGSTGYELYTLETGPIPSPPSSPPSSPSPPSLPTTDPGQPDCLAPETCDIIRHSSIYPQWSLVSTRGWAAGKDDEPRAETGNTRLATAPQAHAAGEPLRAQALAADASGTLVCYSGLLADDQPGQLERQLKLVRGLRRASGTGGIFIAMSTAGTESVGAEATSTLQDEPGVEMVVVSNRLHEHQLNVNGSWVHPQFMGVRHCGIIARKLEEQRGVPFSYAVRIRYDLNMHFESVPLWPIWSSREADLLAFGKSNRCAEMSCLPQDVFFVARRSDAIATWAGRGVRQACTDGSVACAFEGEYWAPNAFATHDFRDQFEATVFSPWFQKGASMFTIWACATPPCDMHELACSEKEWCLEDAGTFRNMTCADMGWCDKYL
jgi:hypothetical protein